MKRDKNKILADIRAYNFAVIEATLYLDTHPNCKSALQYYDKYNTLLTEAKAEYEEMYGPITVFGGTSSECWSWVEMPWPWEYDASACL